MKILLAHDYYQWRGGEDAAFEAEADLLDAYGHDVLRFTVHNDQIHQMGRLKLARATIWNRAASQDLRSIIRRERPDVVHFVNTFPLISPAAYYAVRSEGVPVIQEVSNFRLLCVNGFLQRDGHVCETCLGKFVPTAGIVNGCYRNSRLASAAVAAMAAFHRALGTWTDKVDLYMTQTEFARSKLIEGGLPADKIVAKPYFLDPIPDVGAGNGKYALFVGRLSPEKGLGTLLQAWKRLGDRVPLKIVGDGPLAPIVAKAAKQMPGIEPLGFQNMETVYRLMGEAHVLVFPSEWY